MVSDVLGVFDGRAGGPAGYWRGPIWRDWEGVMDMEADDQRWLDLWKVHLEAWPPMPWTLAKTTDTAVDLLSQQLQDANRHIAMLERMRKKDIALFREYDEEVAALKAELQRYTSGATVSVPLADWNRLCAEAAKASQIPEPVAEESFPGRALRYSWGTK